MARYMAPDGAAWIEASALPASGSSTSTEDDGWRLRLATFVPDAGVHELLLSRDKALELAGFLLGVSGGRAAFRSFLRDLE